MSAASVGSGLPLVIDTSAWNRQAEPELADIGVLGPGGLVTH